MHSTANDALGYFCFGSYINQMHTLVCSFAHKIGINFFKTLHRYSASQ